MSDKMKVKKQRSKVEKKPIPMKEVKKDFGGMGMKPLKSKP
jgi:hypothetical protein